MSDTIFESKRTIKSANGALSFEGCPNHCIDGYYVDPYRHKRVLCENCAELRKKLAKEQVQLDSGESIAEQLKLPPNLLGYGAFNIDTAIPSSERAKIEKWSIEFVDAVLQRMIECVSLGEAIGSSMLINLGSNAHTQNFIYPFLMRSYISGLITAPCVRSIDIVTLRRLNNGEISLEDLTGTQRERYRDMSYDALLTADVCLVYMDAGSGNRYDLELNAVKGLMQLRAWSGKSTVIVTDYYSEKLFDFIGDTTIQYNISTNTVAQSVDLVSKFVDGSESSIKDRAVYIGVKYKAKNDTAVYPYSQVINRSGGSELTSAEAQALMHKASTVGVR